ncbi:MAG: fibronectin type III domain-containing protein [Flavobacteriales bacterium]
MALTTVFTVRLGFTGVTSTALVEKGRNHVTMLTGNIAFPTPTPTLLVITAACNALDVANQAYDFNRGKLEKQTRDTAFTALKDLLRELGGYVQANCNGDKDLILSTGFDTRRPNDPVGPLNAPQNLRVIVAPYPGRLEVRWNGVRGRLLYQLYYTDKDPLEPGGWKLLLQSSKNRHTIENLVSNATYTFRTVALGTAGPSPVSDIASAKAA